MSEFKELQKSFTWQHGFDYEEQFDRNLRICIKLLINYQESDAHRYGSQTRFNNELKEFIAHLQTKFIRVGNE